MSRRKPEVVVADLRELARALGTTANMRERRKGWLRLHVDGHDDAYLHCARLPEIVADAQRAANAGADVTITRERPGPCYGSGTLRISIRRDATETTRRVHATLRLRLFSAPIVDHEGKPSDLVHGLDEIIRQQIDEGRTHGAMLTKGTRYGARIDSEAGGPIMLAVLTPCSYADRDVKPDNVIQLPVASTALVDLPHDDKSPSVDYERGLRSLDGESPDFVRGVEAALAALRPARAPRTPKLASVTTPEELAARRKEAARKAVETRRARLAAASAS